MTVQRPVAITYFSDILCVWAYIAQIRLDEVAERFGTDVRVDHKFCSVFGNTADKIARGWMDRGGYEGFNRHLKHVAQQFGHVTLHPDVWLATRPASSESAHLFVKAIQLSEMDSSADAIAGGSSSTEFAWRLRLAFFQECRDVSTRQVQKEVAEALRIPLGPIETKIDSGEAYAALASDHHDRDRLKIEGSPTFVLNEGRQKLYGNVGYRVIEANIRELLRTPAAGEMSWC
jgi:predicted DsbA family dithiol-disulfide isomerase